MNYCVDFVCGQVLVEAKALSVLAPVHEAQVINYLRASGLKRGLLPNFGTASLQHRRLVWKYEVPTHDRLTAREPSYPQIAQITQMHRPVAAVGRQLRSTDTNSKEWECRTALSRIRVRAS